MADIKASLDHCAKNWDILEEYVKRAKKINNKLGENESIEINKDDDDLDVQMDDLEVDNVEEKIVETKKTNKVEKEKASKQANNKKVTPKKKVNKQKDNEEKFWDTNF